MISTALSTLNTQRGYVYAASSRLSSALELMSRTRDAFVAADSKIRDIDVATEVAQMIRLQVTQQAAQAVEAQANQNASKVLKLLE